MLDVCDYDTCPGEASGQREYMTPMSITTVRCGKREVEREADTKTGRVRQESPWTSQHWRST